MPITWDQTMFERTYGGPESGYSRAFWESFGGEPVDDPMRFWRNVWNQRIVPAIGSVTGAQRVLFVGCGLGLGVERVIDSSFAARNCWGIDNSTYISGLWSTQARSDLRPGAADSKLALLDIRTVTPQQLRTLTGVNNIRFTQIVTEDMISSYTQAELTSTLATVNPLVACENWRAANGKIIHLMMARDGVTPDMTRYPAGGIDPTTNNWASWSAPPDGQGQTLASPGSPAMTMAEWQALKGAPHQFISMENL